MYCPTCECDPCHRELYGDQLRGEGTLQDPANPNAQARKALYRACVLAVHGPLGRGNWVQVPPCVRDLIRELFPDEDEEYMGHKDGPAGEQDDEEGDGSGSGVAA